MNFWDTTNSWVGNYIKIYNKEKFVMIKGFHPAKKDQIRFPNPTQSSRKSSASKKYGQSSWTSLCTEESVGNIRSWIKEKRGNSRNPANCFHPVILFTYISAKIMFLWFLLTFKVYLSSRRKVSNALSTQDMFKAKFQSYNHLMKVMNPVATTLFGRKTTAKFIA